MIETTRGIRVAFDHFPARRWCADHRKVAFHGDRVSPWAKPLGADMSQRHAASLIAAKLSVPPLRAGAVPRHRLHVPMPGRSGTRLTVVVAPAGRGKTTLLLSMGSGFR